MGRSVPLFTQEDATEGRVIPEVRRLVATRRSRERRVILIGGICGRPNKHLSARDRTPVCGRYYMTATHGGVMHTCHPAASSLSDANFLTPTLVRDRSLVVRVKIEKVPFTE